EDALGGEQGGAANGQAIADHVDGWRGGLGGGGGHGSSSFAPSNRASGRGFKGRYGQIRPSFSAGGRAFPSPRPSPRRGEGAMVPMARCGDALAAGMGLGVAFEEPLGIDRGIDLGGGEAG